jgi:regulator of protease activity HflC (stomatin/prohibitin superfamily)
MAEIKTFPLFRHLRAEPTSHVLDYKAGSLRREGPGQAFWFREINTAVAEVPIDDREQSFLFHARSADFQALTVQGVITYRVVDPRRVARRIDFAIDLDTGRWKQTPLEQLAGLVTQLAQQFVIDELVKRDVRRILAAGVAPIRAHIAAGLEAEPALEQLGIQVVAVRVAAVAPTSELEKALQQPTREAIQQDADKATFQRRELAAEAEQTLAAKQAAAAMVEAQGADEREALAAARRAATIDEVKGAQLRIDERRAQIDAAMPADILMALAIRELAGQLGQIDHLTVTPDLLSPLLTRLNGAAK